MSLDRRPAPGRELTWVGEPFELASPGDRGTFVDFDGGPDSYVVDFGPGKVFCCRPDEVEVDPVVAPEPTKRHGSG